jgi:hypothetical protein
MVLHTWNQKMHFHPHIHAIVPGAGLNAKGQFVRVKNANFLIPVSVLSRAFRSAFKEQMLAHGWQCDPAVWHKGWGVHIQPFGTGSNAVKYLGTYVARSVIADSRILAVTDTHVTVGYKDRARGNALCSLTLKGTKFVQRYLRHVLPRGLRSVRYYGYCHPSAKKTRLKVTLLSGKPIDLGAANPALPAKLRSYTCPCCDKPMVQTGTFPLLWVFHTISTARAPP